MKDRNIILRFCRERLLFILVIFSLSSNLSAQFYNNGQDPGRIRWEKIESLHFAVIYPDNLAEVARKTIILLEKNYTANCRQLDKYPGKVTVILHSHTVTSNGFVVWAPKRMEFFMYPDIEGISQDWYSHLSLHEYRHILQVEKMNTGISKSLSWLFGEQNIGPAVAMTPFWLLEGDAVYAETSLSESGRGRIPQFEMAIKAHLMESEKPYSFSKSYLGSYKDDVPNYYQYGYQMISYGKFKFGQDLWTGAFDYIGKHPYKINPLFYYLRNKGAGSKRKLYDSTMNYLKNHWEKSLSERPIVDYPRMNNKKNPGYTSYRSPQIMESGNVLSIKSSLKYIDKFVEIAATGEEKTIFTPGFLNSKRISYKHGKILWDEYQLGGRFDNLSYSVLKEYNINTRTLRYISNNSRFSSPAYSYSGDTIIAIETTLSNKFNLVFISALDAGIFYRVPSPGNIQLLDPAWVENTDQIIAVGLDEHGKSLIKYDRSNNEWSVILSPSPINISRPVSYRKYIIFHGSYDGVDNIFAVGKDGGQLYKISQTRYGAFEPDIFSGSNHLVFSDYSSEGYNISEIAVDSLQFKTFDTNKIVSEQAFFHYGDSLKSITTTNIEDIEISQAKKYSKTGHLFKFHSWAPFYLDYSNFDIAEQYVSPGFTLLSQNHLSTLESQISYEYLNKYHYFHSSAIYKAWLPVFEFSYHHGGIDSTYSIPSTSAASQYSIASYIPLSFNTGKWILGIQPFGRLNYGSRYYYNRETDNFEKGMTYFDTDLFTYFYQKRAYADIVPRLGLIFELRKLSAPFDKEKIGSLFSFASTAYLPGFFRNHGFKMQYQRQTQKPEVYLFNDQFSLPRGYSSNFSSLFLQKFNINYYLPLFYPDFSIEGLLYIQRIRAQLFYDYFEGNDIYQGGSLIYSNANFRSTGLEIHFDYNIFRILFEFSSGIRLSYTMNDKKIVPEFIYTIDLNRF